MSNDEPDERWHSRGYLPHVGGKYFIQHFICERSEAISSGVIALSINRASISRDLGPILRAMG